MMEELEPNSGTHFLSGDKKKPSTQEWEWLRGGRKNNAKMTDIAPIYTRKNWIRHPLFSGL